MKKHRVMFHYLFIALALLLAMLPFVVSLNEVLTDLVERFSLYAWVQNYIVPLEVRLVGVLVRPFGIDYIALPEGFRANGTYARLTWNCLGWQSLLFLGISLIVGLRAGQYTWRSKLETIGIGVLGTFWVNLLRITFTVLLLVYSRRLFAIVFHDYLAAVVTIGWLMAFWWFSYRYVLEEKIKAKL